MTTDVATGRTQLDTAFRALYLQPTAPRQLVDAAYAVLANGAASSDLRHAYETILSAPDVDTDFNLPRQTSPWELLHLRADAPRSVMAAAYDLWRGDAEPLVLRPPVFELVAPPSAQAHEPSTPLPHAGACPEPDRREGLGVRIESTTYLSAFEELSSEELFGITKEIEQPPNGAKASPPLPQRGRGAGGEGGTTSPPRVGEGLGVGSDHPTLIGPDGTSFTLTHRPLRIGTQPSCDIVVRAETRIEARVWRNKGRVLVHALGQPGLVLVNGGHATWAVLTEGDTLAIGPASFSFRAAKLT